MARNLVKINDGFIPKNIYRNYQNNNPEAPQGKCCYDKESFSQQLFQGGGGGLALAPTIEEDLMKTTYSNRIRTNTGKCVLGQSGDHTGLVEELSTHGTAEFNDGVLKFRGELVNITANGNTTLDLETTNRFLVSMTGNTTLSTLNDEIGDNFTIYLRGSSYTLSWFSGIKWTGGSQPAVPTTGRVAMIAFTKLDTNEYIGTASQEAY